VLCTVRGVHGVHGVHGVVPGTRLESPDLHLLRFAVPHIPQTPRYLGWRERVGRVSFKNG
jgi:hypothetical protein